MYNYDEELNQINVNDMYELFGVDVDLKENKKDYNEEHNNINLSIKIIVIEENKEYKIELDSNSLINILKEVFKLK